MGLFRSLLPVLLFLTAALSAFSADRISDSFSGDLPASVRTVFFFDLQKIRTSPLHSVSQGAGEAAALLSGGEKALSGRGIDPGFSAGALFFAGDRIGILLDSSLSPDLLTDLAAAPDGGSGIAVTKTQIASGQTMYILTGAGSDGKADESFAFSFFPDRTGRILVSTASQLPQLLQSEKGWYPQAQASLKPLPGDAALEGVLYPDRSMTSADGASPLWNGVGRIAFAFSWKEHDPYPFRGSVLFFPRAADEAERVRRNVEDLVKSAYAAGREKGEIRPEMLFAFQVLPGPGCTELRIRLTGPDAEDFTELFADQLKKGAFGKCL
ncbi:MAG: hypothetical protein J5944_12155 [Lentisphaeria bacterium]|nr:hypothetical protein [Lentisphaeria bacterium]